MYRKTSEKSRAWNIKRIDYFLLFAAITLCVIFIGINLFFKKSAAFGRTEIFIDSRCEDLFGRDAIDKLIKEFEEQNSELRISVSSAGDQSSPPDIVFFEDSRFSALVRQETLVPLDPYMRAESGAGQRAVPLVSFMDLLFYNIEILRAAGFDRPPKTREEFLAYAKAAAGLNSGVYGAALGLSPDDPEAPRRDVFSWIWAAGGDFFPPEREGKPWFGDKAALEAITFLGQLNQEGVLAPGTFVKTGADRIEEFSRGGIALLIASSREILPLKKQMGGAAFGVTAIPGPPDTGKSAVGFSGIYGGISAGCARPDDAWAFLVFLVEKSSVLAAKLEAVPGTTAGHGTAVIPGMAADDLSGAGFPGSYIKTDPLYSKAWDIFEASEAARGFSGRPRGEDFERIVREAAQVFFERDQSRAADIAGAIQRRWDEL
jgi:multiple sugar transport system substrate-binding protein